MGNVSADARSAAPDLRAMFMAFLTIALSGFGGVLPFARRQLVERRGWLTEVEFAETLSLCQSLPGPNIVNLSIVVGARFGGAPGAAASVLGLTVAPVVLILVIATLWRRFGGLGHIPAAIHALAAAAAGLLLATALKMARSSLASGPLTAGPVMVAAFVGVGLLKLSLPWVLVGLAPISVLLVRRGRG